MDHNLELINPILEILEIEVSIIPRILEIRAAGRRRGAGGSRGCVVPPWIISGTLFLELCDMPNIRKLYFSTILESFGSSCWIFLLEVANNS